MYIKATKQELQTQKHSFLLSSMGQSPHLTDDDPVRQPAPFLPAGDRVDLIELTSEVTQPVHFQARI